MSHASDAAHSPMKKQAGDSIWKYPDESVCICVARPGENLRSTVNPVRRSRVGGLQAALEIIAEDSGC